MKTERDGKGGAANKGVLLMQMLCATPRLRVQPTFQRIAECARVQSALCASGLYRQCHRFLWNPYNTYTRIIFSIKVMKPVF